MASSFPPSLGAQQPQQAPQGAPQQGDPQQGAATSSSMLFAQQQQAAQQQSAAKQLISDSSSLSQAVDVFIQAHPDLSDVGDQMKQLLGQGVIRLSSQMAGGPPEGGQPQY